MTRTGNQEKRVASAYATPLASASLLLLSDFALSSVLRRQRSLSLALFIIRHPPRPCFRQPPISPPVSFCSGCSPRGSASLPHTGDAYLGRPSLLAAGALAARRARSGGLAIRGGAAIGRRCRAIFGGAVIRGGSAMCSPRRFRGCSPFGAPGVFRIMIPRLHSCWARAAPAASRSRSRD